ncbi:MAG TPA: enoyl-CoA hydratase-related protein [Parvibaculum sp.]|jgi:2-(1,2-epoxy-1,2-dihydrophenyl)acetyl-CoA isomerase
MTAGTYETIVYEKSGGVARLTLNRPEHRNGITGRMMLEMCEALSAAGEDKSVRVLVLKGAGKDFCPGADLKHYTDGASKAGPDLNVDDFRMTTLLHQMPAVTIAAISGACAGAGFGWACACDLRVASRSARFNTAFLDVAVAGDMAGPWSLPRLVGAAKARELYFLPGKFDAAEALRIDLVSRVFDDAAFTAEVDAIVNRLADASPVALRGMKANFINAERMDLQSYVALESERHLRISKSKDTQEAFRAFLEKRKPKFESL